VVERQYRKLRVVGSNPTLGSINLMITFKPLSTLKPGQLFEILTTSYRELIEKYDPINKEKYLADWQQSDKDAFDYPETIGKCVLVSYVDNQPVGFVSYDPRNFPNFGIVGQNCVLPKFRGHSFGKIQIEKLLEIFKDGKCVKALVSTGANDFFIPAQKMYKSLGFIETGRHLNEKWGFTEIEYQKELV
jgi:ribosomal protein S18 acetylase RimI-like enzyme